MSDPDKEYDAILIDTSIYDRNGLRLEKGLLSKLTQFKRSPVNFLMPDVMKNEVKSHLQEKIIKSRNALEKSLNDATDHLFFQGSTLNDARAQLLDTSEVDNLADVRINAFIENTGAEVIDSGSLVSVSEVLKQYFTNQAPFAETGNKKCEFPDAIALLAIEEWAKNENKNVLAVAKDKDWEKYCDNSSRIDYEDDLVKALEIFNKTSAPYLFKDLLEKSLNENSAPSIIDQIGDRLTSALERLTPDQEADSHLFWEPDGCHAWYKDFELPINEFRIIESDEDYVVLETTALITVEAEGDFSLSIHDSIDKDYVGMGSVTASTEEAFESKILIKIVGDLNGSLENVDVDEVEIVNPLTSIDFGTIDLDYGDFD